MSKVRSVGAVMTALLVACFAFQLNASMLSPALVLMEKELHTTAAIIGLTQTVFFTAARWVRPPPSSVCPCRGQET